MTDLDKFALAREIRRIFGVLMQDDRTLLGISLCYGIGVSLLTLAVPVSVQLLINSVAHIASKEAIISLAFLLLFLLVCSGFLIAMQHYVLELFERRIYARLSADITMRNIFADHQYSEHTSKSDLTNRYFDIMTIQKVIPGLIVGMFGFLLQMIVGIIVVSSYHPFLMIFNACFIIVLWLIWRIWAYDALAASVTMSEDKYRTAKHIEDIAIAHDYYMSHSHSEYGIAKTDRLIKRYLESRKSYFRPSFRQYIALLMMYAVASAGFLGIGGILVINEELTLGQLVAAELILTAIFYGSTKLGYSLMQAYELGAALEEIDRLYQMPEEKNTGSRLPSEDPADLIFDNVGIPHKDGTCLNFHINAGSKILISCDNYRTQQYILQVIARHLDMASGRVLLGKDDIRDINARRLRDSVIVLDRPFIFESTVKEYLTLNRPDVTSGDLHAVLEMMELNEVIDRLEFGMRTTLLPGGFPLSPTQTLRLKIAAALLMKPRIIIINQFFDVISEDMQRRIMLRIRLMREITFICFSNNTYEDLYDDRLSIED